MGPVFQGFRSSFSSILLTKDLGKVTPHASGWFRLLNYITHAFRTVAGVTDYILGSIMAKGTESGTRLTDFMFLF